MQAQATVIPPFQLPWNEKCSQIRLIAEDLENVMNLCGTNSRIPCQVGPSVAFLDPANWKQFSFDT
jgi:hypothetical protein